MSVETAQFCRDGFMDAICLMSLFISLLNIVNDKCMFLKRFPSLPSQTPWSPDELHQDFLSLLTTGWWFLSGKEPCQQPSPKPEHRVRVTIASVEVHCKAGQHDNSPLYPTFC